MSDLSDGEGQRLMGQVFKAAVLGFSLLWLSGCISTNAVETTNAFERVDGEARLLLLEPDVSISFIKASEVREPRADWTQQAEKNLVGALRRQLAQRDVTINEFKMANATPREQQLVKLHEVVGETIVQHRYAYLPLPSKDEKFDWSLGPGVQELAASNDADYALLLLARGEYASSGKVLTNIIFTAVGVGTGSVGGQLAFASLIDLRSGDIVWFNVATTGAGIDMREEPGAEQVVRNLLKTMPL